MCLGIPARITRIEGDYAEAEINGATLRIGIQLLDSVKTGDYVLVHTGYALEKLNMEEAMETIKTLQQLKDFNVENSTSTP
jgi:hydrogenase expression/formation protein HypC